MHRAKNDLYKIKRYYYKINIKHKRLNLKQEILKLLISAKLVTYKQHKIWYFLSC
jgi:hypothetical protein